MYASAVAVTQALQQNAIDPSECELFTLKEINSICVASGVVAYEEQLVFKIAVLMLQERHQWSYTGVNKQKEVNNVKNQ